MRAGASTVGAAMPQANAARQCRAGRGWLAPLPLLALAVAGLVLAGCGALGGPPPQVFALTPKSTFADNLPDIGERLQLVVEQPESAGGLNTNRIAVKPHPLQLDYYAGARWTERAPLMVQTLLLESFENTGKIISVGREAIGLRPDFVLRGDLREFQAQYFDARSSSIEVPHILVQFNAKLIEQPRERIFDSRNFESCVRARSGSLDDVIAAFDEALGNVMKDAVQWSLYRVVERTPFRALGGSGSSAATARDPSCRPG
ncbi:MAG: ABC-type transport auxiliary lipoprotein family protein [Sneathiellaceae bacterium]